MTALVPLNSADLLERLHEVGVGEVYVGFHDDEWDSRFGKAELNRMSGFGLEANPFDFEQMCRQVTRTRALGMHAYVCFNATTYTSEQIRYIASAYLPALAASGTDGVILSSQALIEPARTHGLGAVISTIAGVFNAQIATYYAQRGATRLILPRDLSSDEIAEIVQAVPNMQYEVFLMRNGCMFSDSHCLGCHRAGKPSLCRSLRTGTWKMEPVLSPEAEASLENLRLPSVNSILSTGNTSSGANTPAVEGFMERACETEWLLNTFYHVRTCGLCALWRFEKLGVSAYKVVGRGDDADDLVADAGLVVRNTALARACATEEEYLACMELPRNPATLCAYNGLSCYYPELAHTRLTW